MKSQSTTLATIVLSAMALVVLPFVDARASWVSDAPVVYPNPRSYFEAHVDLAQPEQARIRAHLESVEALLRARSTDGLTDEQKRNRLARLDDLRAYREAGVFPRNLDFPDRLIPYFIDAAGTACAMGQLIIASGHADLANDVRATMNNAYIGEIAAADPRLQEWVDEQGMTLEEAAMVQPGYGPPSITFVVKIALDPARRPWVTGPDALNLGGTVMGLRDSSGWKVVPGFTAWGAEFGFCIAGDGRVMNTGGTGGVIWPITPTMTQSPSPRFSINTLTDCAWQAGDTVAWAGGRKGLVRLRRTPQDTLALAAMVTPSGYSDTVNAVAIASGRVWAATHRGLYARSLQTPTTVTTWDSAALGGSRVTGIKGLGGTVWVGLEGRYDGGMITTFSTRGLRRIKGDSIRAIRSGPGTLFVMPNDTVLALAPRDSVSVWMALPSGFYRANPDIIGPLKVADLPASVTINDMVGDTSGFYVATSNGVYQYSNGILSFIGSPVVSLRPGISKARTPAVSAPQVRLRAGGAGEASLINVQGRVVDPAAGVYVNRKPTPPVDTEAPAR